MELTGRVAVVTGASRGLGRAIARKLAETMVVAAASRTVAELESLAAEVASVGGRAVALQLDLADRGSIAAAAERIERELGPVAVLVNNAGVGWYKPLLEWTPEEIDLTIDVNLRGAIHLTRAVLPAMIKNGGGQIINVASDLGRRFLANMAPYVAAKHGMVGFGGSLLREVKASNVKVTTLTPGIIDTYFGGGEPGRDPSWALEPEKVAEFVWSVLQLPDTWVADEIAIHPLHQDF